MQTKYREKKIIAISVLNELYLITHEVIPANYIDKVNKYYKRYSIFPMYILYSLYMLLAGTLNFLMNLTLRIRSSLSPCI